MSYGRNPVLTGDDRAAVAAACAARYRNGWTIRAIARRTGRSYGSIHRLLIEAGVTLRPRSNTRTH